MKISVVIAAYNEAENIGSLTNRLISTLDTIADASWQLIYVIEGADQTRAVADSFASQRREIRILYNPEPSGLANAFKRGFDAVAPDAGIVVTMDADLNHQPEELPRLIAALFDRKADIVVGSRKVAGSATDGMPLWKKTLSNSVNRYMRRLIGVPVADMTSGYRVYRYGSLRQLSFHSTGFAFLPEMLMRAHALGQRIVEEPIHFIFRIEGVSKMKLAPTALSYLKLLTQRIFSLQAKAAIESSKDSHETLHTTQK